MSRNLQVVTYVAHPVGAHEAPASCSTLKSMKPDDFHWGRPPDSEPEKIELDPLDLLFVEFAPLELTKTWDGIRGIV